MSKKTVIFGATTHTYRYAYLAANKLSSHGHEIVPLGIRSGSVANEEILDINTRPTLKDVDTVTMYLRPAYQTEFEDYLISLGPKRIVFNPGTENPSFEEKARAHNIETLHACTLVMLSADQY